MEPNAQPATPDDDEAPAPILVGYDGSPGAEQALTWAVDEADRRHTSLTVVQSWHEPVLSERTWLERWDDPAFEERAAAAALDQVVHQAVAGHPGTAFASQLVAEHPVDALLAAAADSQLVVVGSRGHGGFAGLLLGSVAERLAGTSPSTVVVVRAMPPQDGPIVVGVDGSIESRRALRWATAEGRIRSCPVRAVLAWTAAPPFGARGAEPFGAAASEADARMALHHILVEELGPDGAESVTCTPVRSPATRALVEGAEDAALLVIGGPTVAGPDPDHLGSVARQVLRHGPCPVVVTR
jgi:nucleotide-binding universal stress UspA family protein